MGTVKPLKPFPPEDTPTTLEAYEQAGRTALKLYELSSVLEGRPCSKYTADDVRSWGLPVFGKVGGKRGGHGHVPLAAFKRFLLGSED
jgi:hypothetical protein